MSLVCTHMSFVCFSYVLVCHPYVTRLWFYHEPTRNALFSRVTCSIRKSIFACLFIVHSIISLTLRGSMFNEHVEICLTGIFYITISNVFFLMDVSKITEELNRLMSTVMSNFT